MKGLWLFQLFLVLLLILTIGCAKVLNKEDIKSIELSSISRDSDVNVKIFNDRSYVYEIKVNYPANLIVSKNKNMSDSEFAALTELIDKSNFFNLRDEYKSGESEAYTLLIKTDKYSKSIKFYKNSNAPKELLNIAGFIHALVKS